MNGLPSAFVLFSILLISFCASDEGSYCVAAEPEEQKEAEEANGQLPTKEKQEPQMTILQTAGKLVQRVARTNMAWRSSGESNKQLVENLFRNELFTDDRVKAAMLSVDRGDYAPSTPYGDHPVAIGYGATISAPHMHASALERLKDHLVEGSRALDVGSGSGYLTACMAKMVGESGKIVGIEHIGELVELSKGNVEKHDANLISSGRILFVEGDGRQGYQPEAPYNAIHVGAAAPKIPPKLIEQLANGGRMLIPVGDKDSGQRFVQVDKNAEGEVKVTDLFGVIYVPLTDKSRQVGE